jgi:hypothetical protein
LLLIINLTLTGVVQVYAAETKKENTVGLVKKQNGQLIHHKVNLKMLI